MAALLNAQTPPVLAERQPVLFNPALTFRGLAATLCLLGLSSKSGATPLAYLAVGVGLYSLCVGVPVWRMITLSACLRLIRFLPHLAGFAGGATAAVFLANAPYAPLAVAGSLVITVLVAAIATTSVLVAFRAVLALAPYMGRCSSAGIERLRLYACLIRL